VGAPVGGGSQRTPDHSFALCCGGDSFGAAEPPIGIPSASAAPCPDVEVVFARGTFEPPGIGATGEAFVDSLRSQVGGKSVDVYPVNYPASLDFATAADGVVDTHNEQYRFIR
jgi:cutinase